MALKDYKYSGHKCIINNHSEFIRLLKFFLKHGAEDYVGNDVPMFENIWDICEELDVKYENYDYEGDDEEGGLLITDISELEEFLLKNINKDTLVPSEDEYPVLVDWYKEDSFDRVGKSSIKILNFTSMCNFKIVNDYLIDFMKELRIKNSYNREMCKLRMEFRKEKLNNNV